MGFLIGKLILYAGYGFAVLALLWLLRKAVRGLGRLLDRPWRAFHRWRLGQETFAHHAVRRSNYSYVIGQRKRENIARDPRLSNRLRWEFWAFTMWLSGLCYTEAYDDVMYEEAERKRAQERREWAAQKEEYVRRQAEEKRRRRAQEKRERERAERLRREQERRQREATARTLSDYDMALLLFGLREGYTQRDFNKAYRKAMMAAHPDVGGSTEEAQAVNGACDLIKRRNGW